MTTPTVFISYSHDSAQHADRVLALSDRLVQDGIDVVLDQYESSPPEGWPLWMDKHIRSADFVLMVCTETYFRRVRGVGRTPCPSPPLCGGGPLGVTGVVIAVVMAATAIAHLPASVV
jgi:hypothetical protein